MTDDLRLALDKSRRVALIAMMTALTLVANYVVIVAPNVEIGSSVLFVTGLLFGVQVAVAVVLLVAVVFGLFNPWGPSIFIYEVWITQVVGWLFIAIAGHVIGRSGSAGDDKLAPWQYGVVGVVLTLFYDTVTNLGWAWASSIPFAVTMMTGLPFMAVHVISNAFIFSIVVTRLESTVRRQMSSVLWESSSGIQDIPKSKKA
ncbi:MAG: hypothetical protein ACP6KW_01815 [Candidatus Thorarchaeota archaeon]